MCPLPENSVASLRLSRLPEPHEYSSEERALLLNLAYEAIASAFDKRELSLTLPSPHLAEPRGVFTTLYYRHDLRGCLGYVFASVSLYQAVAETARGAAFDDTRFPPLKPEELAEIEVSLSVLSPLQSVRPEEIAIGKHGLLIQLGSHRGLLLPQVPIEHGWDRITFLQQTCRKAGLPGDAWRAGATIEAFTAEVFGGPRDTAAL
jgi:AmmeMemoRadiSam system protein A